MSRRVVLSAALALTLTAVVGIASSAIPAGAGTTKTYVVLYKRVAVPSGSTTQIQNAGGSVIASYPQIGVIIARSDNDAFASTMKRDSRIFGVSATDGFGVRLPGSVDEEVETVTVDPSLFPTSSDPLAGLQWDMDQIHAPEAHAVTGGSSQVVVGDIDTGLDFTHPDLAPNYDAANSADCSSGAPTPLLPGNDANGHGTHTAGTIASAANGIGIVGVAPNVKIAGIKSSNDDGFFFPEMVICSFMWAAGHGIDVTNNSYFADPWLFNCKNDPEQRAIWNAERRAISYAQSVGVVVISAAGNENIDLSKTNVDVISPDFPPGNEQERIVTNACSVVPVEVPGVVGVSANGNLLQKAYYSTYGVGVVNVVAPGGDRRFQLTSAAPNGRVLSTWPAALFVDGNPLFVKDPSGATYVYLQGTSMASPHVAGVAALVRSVYPELMPGAVTAMLQSTADPQACPPNPFNPGPPFDFLAICTGGPGYNSFYGHGQVNALSAVT
jgi:subtilisin family serine protease